MVVLHGLPEFVGDHAGVLAGVFLLGIQDLQPVGTCSGAAARVTLRPRLTTAPSSDQPREPSPVPSRPSQGGTWKQLEVLGGLKRDPVLQPGDAGGREGQRLADQGDGVVDGHRHLFIRTVLGHAQDGGSHWGWGGDP